MSLFVVKAAFQNRREGKTQGRTDGKKKVGNRKKGIITEELLCFNKRILVNALAG